MKTKFLILMAIFLLVPFVSASAGLVTLDKVKKAGEIWLKGGDDFGASGWSVQDFDGAARLSGSSNPKSNTVDVTFSQEGDFYFAVFKKNSKLKYWGLAKYDNGGYSLQKNRKKSFIPADWAFKRVVPVKAEAPAEVSENTPSSEGALVVLKDEPSGEGSEDKMGGEFKLDPVSNVDDNQSPNGPAPVPEPATMLLLGSGLIGLAGVARSKAKKTRK